MEMLGGDLDVDAVERADDGLDLAADGGRDPRAEDDDEPHVARALVLLDLGLPVGKLVGRVAVREEDVPGHEEVAMTQTKRQQRYHSPSSMSSMSSMPMTLIWAPPVATAHAAARGGHASACRGSSRGMR